MRDTVSELARLETVVVPELTTERDRYKTALERIASLEPRPALDPHDCEGRPRRLAREALTPPS